jgi:hypothetical protein
MPADPPFGLSFHEELALLVAAGVSPINTIIGGTSLAASTYRLYGRGAIRIGMRADLVLLSSDPTVDITNSRSIQSAWVGGIETTLLLDGDPIPIERLDHKQDSILWHIISGNGTLTRTEFRLPRYLGFSHFVEQVYIK